MRRMSEGTMTGNMKWKRKKGERKITKRLMMTEKERRNTKKKREGSHERVRATKSEI